MFKTVESGVGDHLILLLQQILDKSHTKWWLGEVCAELTLVRIEDRDVWLDVAYVDLPSDEPVYQGERGRCSDSYQRQSEADRLWPCHCFRVQDLLQGFCIALCNWFWLGVGWLGYLTGLAGVRVCAGVIRKRCGWISLSLHVARCNLHASAQLACCCFQVFFVTV